MKQFFLALSLIFVFIPSFVQAQKTTCVVDKRFHDFGKIKEDGGKVKAIYTFKNTGNADLLIIKAEPSCGCTVGEWTKEAIAPGKTGTVTAIFDPKNMVGIIDKSIGVYTNAVYASIIVLEMRGEVLPRDKTMDDIFPYRVGNLMFDKELVELGDVPHNKFDSAYVVMFNDGQYPIKINNISPLPDGYRIRPAKYVIEPNEEVRLYASVDGNKLNDFGPFNKNFRLYTDDPDYSEKPLFMFGSVKYNFGTLSKKELKSAPKLSLDKSENDFGEQPIGSVVNTAFKITNYGKNDLVILSIKNQCSCTDATSDKKILKKGESATINVKFDLLGHAGNIQKNITIYTNDPKNSMVDILVRAKLY